LLTGENIVGMSKIEELVYNTYQYGKREELFKEVKKIKDNNPNMPLEDIYDEAYRMVMNT
jgi:hypothetical protein